MPPSYLSFSMEMVVQLIEVRVATAQLNVDVQICIEVYSGMREKELTSTNYLLNLPGLILINSVNLQSLVMTMCDRVKWRVRVAM